MDLLNHQIDSHSINDSQIDKPNVVYQKRGNKYYFLSQLTHSTFFP